MSADELGYVMPALDQIHSKRHEKTVHHFNHELNPKSVHYKVRLPTPCRRRAKIKISEIMLFAEGSQQPLD